MFRNTISGEVRTREDLHQLQHNACGGILADGPGLGKTLQALSLVAYTRPQAQQFCQSREPTTTTMVTSATLVVCPAALIYHWMQDTAKFFRPGVLRIAVYTGPTRQTQYAQGFGDQYDVILTSYHIVMRDFEKKDTSPLYQSTFFRLICDELHMCKSRTKSFYQSVFNLQSLQRWGLTGTPIQNTVDEIQTLIMVLWLWPLADKPAFIKYVSEVLLEASNDGARPSMATMPDALRAVVLRRTREDQPLPGISKYSHICSIHPAYFSEPYKRQLACLELAIQTTRQLPMITLYTIMLLFLSAGEDALLPEHRKLLLGDSSSDIRLAAIDVLRRQQLRNQAPIPCFACHQPVPVPLEVIEILDDDDEVVDDDLVEDDDVQNPVLAYISRACGHVCCTRCRPTSAHAPSCACSLEEVRLRPSLKQAGPFDGVPSPKAKYAITLVKILRRSDFKIIIFSQYIRPLYITGHHLCEAMPTLRCSYFTGKLSADQKATMLRNLRAGHIDVLFATIGAGALGHNMVPANCVIFLDSCWNPTKDGQAEDRVLRQPQHQDVHVYHVHLGGTMDERVRTVQENKLHLAALALGGFSNLQYSPDDLRMLLKLPQPQDHAPASRDPTRGRNAMGSNAVIPFRPRTASSSRLVSRPGSREGKRSRPGSRSSSGSRSPSGVRSRIGSDASAHGRSRLNIKSKPDEDRFDPTHPDYGLVD